MRIVKLSILGLFASSAWSMLVPLEGQECGEITIYDCPPQNRPGPSPTTETVLTDAYSIEFSSASGAVGDVVAVPVILNSQIENPGFISLDLAICHDSTISEVVGAPLYTDEFLSLLDSSGASLYPVEEANDSPQIRQCGHGFLLNIGLDRNAYNARFPSNVPLNMMTLFYRLKGTPGASGQVEACDASLIRGLSRCNYNHFHTDSLDTPQGWDIVSTVHSPGILTVLAGPATHPTRPPEPPRAN